MAKLTHAVSGSTVKFLSADEMPFEQIKVNIDLVQDGSGEPFPPGGSNNIIPDGTDTTNGYVSGYFLNADGTTGTDSALYISEYFPVTANQAYTLQSTTQLNASSVCFYDSEKEYISGVAFSKRSSFTTTAPADAVYARCIQYKAEPNIVQMELGSTATEIKPYSNIRPFRIWSGCDIVTHNKNLIPINATYVAKKYINASGTVAGSTAYSYMSSYMPVLPNTKYTIAVNKITTSNAAITVPFYDENKQFLSRVTARAATTSTGRKSGSFTTPENTRYLRFSFPINAEDIQIELGDSETEYVEKDGTEMTVTFPNEAGTVCSGILTVNNEGTATLAVDKVYYEFDGSEDENWAIYPATKNYAYINLTSSNIFVDTKVISNMYRQGLAASQNDVINVLYSSASSKERIYIHPSWMDNNTTAADIKTYFMSHPLQVLINLQTPQIYTFMAQQTNALIGENYVYANTGDIVVTYPFCDHLTAMKRKMMLNPHVETTSGTIATFNSKLTLPLKELQIGIEPMQDLNGYDYPWPPGGSANIIPDGTDTDNGYIDSYYIINDGTYVSNSSYYVSEYFAVTAGETYILQNNGSLTTPGVCFYDSEKEYISGESFSKRSSFTVTAPANAVYARCTQRKDRTVPVQMEIGTTATDIKPYSNVCPISGWTNATIVCKGKNLFDNNAADWVTSRRINANGVVTASSASGYQYSRTFFYLPPVEKITGQINVKDSVSSYFIICFYDRNKEFLGSQYIYTSTSAIIGLNTETIDVPNGSTFFRVSLTKDTNKYENIQFEIGEKATAYKSYSGGVYNITFPADAETVYGSTLTIDKDGNGTLVVDREIKTITSCSNGTIYYARYELGNFGYIIPGMYGIGNALKFWQGAASDIPYGCFGLINSSGYNKAQVIFCFKDCRKGNATNTKNANQEKLTELNNAGTPLQICYKLSSPTTYTFTASQVRTIFGLNNIFADTGDVVKCDYWEP